MKEGWFSISFGDDSCDAYNIFVDYEYCFVDVKTIND